jgi:hypothetical protein
MDETPEVLKKKFQLMTPLMFSIKHAKQEFIKIIMENSSYNAKQELTQDLHPFL